MTIYRRQSSRPARAATRSSFVGSIERLTERNEDYRHVLFTGRHLQLVVMSLEPGEEIGAEVHRVDQFFRIEQGSALFLLGRDGAHRARAGDVVIVPAGTRHNVVNLSRTRPLKLYTLYAPPQHAAGKRERRKLARRA